MDDREAGGLMNHVGAVSTEGAPVLIVDAAAVRSWVPTDGRCVRDTDLRAHRARLSGPLGVEGSALLVRVASRRFRCIADRVAIAAGDAVRCLIEPA